LLGGIFVLQTSGTVAAPKEMIIIIIIITTIKTIIIFPGSPLWRARRVGSARKGL
jgi:hypothetical protein